MMVPRAFSKKTKDKNKVSFFVDIAIRQVFSTLCRDCVLPPIWKGCADDVMEIVTQKIIEF